MCSNTPGTQCSHRLCMSTTPWVDKVVFKHTRDSVLAQSVHEHNTLGGQGCVQTQLGLGAPTEHSLRGCPCMSTTRAQRESLGGRCLCQTHNNYRLSVPEQSEHEHSTLGGRGCVQTHQTLGVRTVHTSPWVEEVVFKHTRRSVPPQIVRCGCPCCRV